MQMRPGGRNVRSMLLGNWKDTPTNKDDVWEEQGNCYNIEIFLFFPRSKRGEFQGAIVGMKSPGMYIRPWALSEDI